MKPAQVFAWAADCRPEDSGEDYIGVRYKASLVEDELSETGWVLLFAGSGFTNNGEYQPHFVDLMIKAGWANLYDDQLCASGFPRVIETRPLFNIEFGISDYEDATLQDNDIAMLSQDPELFPRVFTNIDSTDPNAADKVMATYQVDEGGALEGREIEISLERGEITALPPDENYFMDPDLEEPQLCKTCSQDDIQYRQWIATLKVPSLGIDSSVDLYINASQGDKLRGDEILNFMWENPGRTAFESDKYQVIIYDIELKTTSGTWQKAEKYLVDLRAAPGELPFNDSGELVGGYRKVDYKGQPAIEASFGYGYNDYVIDGNPYDYELTDDTKGVIDLTTPGPPTNTLPTPPKVNIMPEFPLTTDDLVCSITTPSTDDDGDTITYSYTWYKNDNLQPSVTSNTIDSSLTTEGDTWRCEVTPYDGENYGPTAQDRVFIGNSPPNTPGNPSPANNASGVSINANLSWSGGDPDGDAVTYDVYFGSNPTPPLVSDNQAGTNCDLETLAYNTKYYWKIVAVDEYGLSTTGSLYDFITQAAPINPPRAFRWWWAVVGLGVAALLVYFLWWRRRSEEAKRLRR